MEFHSFYDYLGSLSLWGILTLCAVVYGLAVLILYPMRYVFEGVAYNVARSSNIGDFFLTAILLNAWMLLQGGVSPPTWASGFWWQAVCAAIGVIVALHFTFNQTALYRTHVTDIYHNSVVMCFLTSALVYVAPLILWSGIWSYIIGSIALVAIWIGCIISDTKDGRMQQRDWLAKHRPDLKFKY